MLRTILLILMTFIFLIVGFFIYLFNGIHIENISVSNMKFSQLYLKYDKKLIFSVKELNIKPSSDESKIKFDPTWIGYADEILTYFQTIKIENINYGEKHAFIEFKNNKFILKNKKTDIHVDFKILGDNLLVNSEIKLSKYNLNIKSKITAPINSLSTKIEKLLLNIDSSVTHKDFTIDFKANLKNANLKYEVIANKITNLKFIKQFITLKPDIEDLIYNQLSFDYIELNTLKGNLDLKNIDKFDIKSLNTSAVIYKPKLQYPDAPIISLNKLLISLKNNKINIDMEKTEDNQTISFSGSLNTTTALKSIDIDAAYFYKDININTQSTINNNTVYKIDVKSLHIKDQNLTFSGIVNINPDDIISKNDFTLNIDNLNFIFEPKLPSIKAKKVYLQYLNNDILLNLNQPTFDKLPLDGSDVVIKDIISDDKTILKLNLKTTALLQDKFLNILNFYEINLPFYQSFGENKVSVNIDIPFNDDKIEVLAFIKSKNTQIEIDGKAIPITQLTVKVNNNNTVDATIQINPNPKQDINIESQIDLNTSIAKGTVLINTFIYDTSVEINNDKFNYTLDFGQETKILNIPKYDLKYEKSNNTHNIEIKSFNNLVKFIKDIEIDNLKEKEETNLLINSSNDFETIKVNIQNMYIKLNDSYFDKSPLSSTDTQLLTTKINLYNGSVKYKGYNLIYDSAKINSKQSSVDIILTNKDTSISSTIDLSTKKLTINSDKLTHTFINEFLDKELLKDGFLTLKAKGILGQLKGKLFFHKTTVQNLLFLNNLIAFINTTPAIINPIFILPTLYRLSKTNFDMQGYYIENGWIDFIYNKNQLLKIENSYTKGQLIDFKVKGDINLKSRKINITADAIFMKDYARIISKIPIIGYLSTNKEGNFATQVDIFGTLDKPEFETHTIKTIFQSIEEKASDIFKSN